MNKIALAPTSLPNAQPMEYVAAASKAGYEAIGLRTWRSPGNTYPFHPVVDDPNLARDVKKAIADSGMEVVDILSFYMQPETDFDAMMKPLEFGREIGAKYALVIADDQDWNRMVDRFGHFCDLCANLSMVAAIEAPVVRREINRVAKAEKLIKDCGRSNAAISLDPLHFFRLGEDPEILDNIDQKLYPYTQITDGAMEGPRLALGTGRAPLYGILDRLTPEIPLSLEWQPPRDPSPSHDDWAKHILEECKAYLNAYYASKK